MARRRRLQKLLAVLASVALGMGIGVILIFARSLPVKWYAAIVVTMVAPVVFLLAKDIEKLFLVILVVDIPLGLDVALGNRTGHTGGPAGFVVSLMTIIIVLGYLRWLRKPPEIEGSKGRLHLGITVPALVYLFTVLVSSFQATEVWFTATQLFLEIQFLLMMIYVAAHVRSWDQLRIIYTTLAFSVLVESLLMFAQYYLGFEFSAMSIVTSSASSDITSASARIAGTLGGANLAATFLAAGLALIFSAYLANGRLINRVLALAAFFTGVAALVLTQSRSGWSAFAVAMLIILFGALLRRTGGKAIWLLLAMLIILGLGFSTVIVERLITYDRRSAESRVWYNTLAINAINDHFFAGVGANNQRYVIENNDYAPPELIGRERSAIHNTYLATWVETGLFGFLALVWLVLAGIGYAASASRRTHDQQGSLILLGLTSGSAVFAVHMATATFTGRRFQFMWLVLGLIIATIRIVEVQKE
jgi:O-antigen ligase